MGILQPIEALTRFQENEERIDKFVNGNAGEHFVTSEGDIVPSIQNMLYEKAALADNMVATKQADAESMIAAKGDAADIMISSKAEIADTTIAGKATDADNMISAKAALADDMIQAKAEEVDLAMTSLTTLRDEALSSATNAATSEANALAAAEAAAQSAEDAAGAAGDMTKAVYDPLNKNGDAFDRANHHGAISIALEDIAGLGSAASAETTDFATAAQGAKADSAVQPEALGSAASMAASAFATAAQGAKADSAVQPESLGTAAGMASSAFATAAQGTKADSAVQPADLGSAAAQDSGAFASAAQGAKADSAVQPAAMTTEIGTAVADMAKTTVKQSFSGAQRSTIVPVTFTSTITIDVDAGNLFKITEAISSSFTLANFANAAANVGLTGTIRFKIDATGGRHITMGSAFKPIGQSVNYDLPQAANVVGYIDFQIWAEDEIRYSISGVAAA